MGRYLKFWGRGENLIWGDLAFYRGPREPFRNHASQKQPPEVFYKNTCP